MDKIAGVLAYALDGIAVLILGLGKEILLLAALAAVVLQVLGRS